MLLWLGLVVRALQFPWTGVVSYAGFAVLCPKWNWRWGLPDWDYQKFLAGATLLGWLMMGLSRQRLTRAGKLSMMALAGYLALTFLSSTQTLNPEKSAKFLDISWKIVLMSFVSVYTLQRPKYLLVFAFVVVFCQGWNAFNINQLYYQQGINVSYFRWNFLDNNTYSISSLPVMAIAFAAMVTTTHRYGRILAGIVFLLQMHQLMILQSRGTMLGALLLAALGVWFMPKNKTSWSIVLAGFLAGAVLAGPSVVQEFTSSFAQSGSLDSSAESRYRLWKAGAGIMKDHPWLGVGPWAGEVLVPQYYEGGLPGVGRKALHNLFFEVGTGSGIPALILYLLAFAIPWWGHFQQWQINRFEMPEWMQMVNLAVLCGIPGYWLSSMFSSGALIEAPYFLIVIGVASLSVFSRFLDDEYDQAQREFDDWEESEPDFFVDENSYSDLQLQ